ncbi:TPA: hypothetical protein J1556_002663 [Escherichia coli]|nr:hypothetical protein [Escherichia coli]HBA8247384.1 hypothetical protein [Escherichia coli]HBA8544001.1 hypothetical protein [Escherichia coli]HBB0103451.1 hypothetical protein [Escherichia coli]
MSGKKQVKAYMPWSEQYLPFHLLASCKKSIAENVLNASGMPGWAWDGHASCDGNDVRFTILKTGGFTFWLDSVEQFITPQPMLSVVNDDKAYLTWHIQDVSKYSKQALSIEKFNSIKEIKKMLTQEFSMSHQKIDFGRDVAMNLGGYNIIKCDFSFSVPSDPGIYFPVLLKVYGIVINKIEYTEGSGQWRILGEFWGVQ